MIQVAIIEDHPIFIDGLKNLINNSGIASVIDTADNGKHGLIMLRDIKPDVLLLDINLPDCTGIELCKEIHAKYPSLNILALTSFSEPSVIKKMLDAGTRGYINKNASPMEILTGIEIVAGGEIFLCHEVDLLMKKNKNANVYLTRRETEILKLVVDGYTNNEIADKLFVNIETVNTHRKNLLFKLDVRNTALLVKIALEQKLI